MAITQLKTKKMAPRKSPKITRNATFFTDLTQPNPPTKLHNVQTKKTAIGSSNLGAFFDDMITSKMGIGAKPTSNQRKANAGSD